MNYQKVKYKLTNHDIPFSEGSNPLWLTTDPKNWDNSERTFKRSDKTFGVYTELSKDLIFTKEAADFLRLAYSIKDIEANVTMEEHKFHPITEVPYLHSTGFFDFSEYKSNKLEVKVPFRSGGLNALINSQIKEKFEIERLDAINGNVINPVDKKLVALTSRRILLVSELRGAIAETEYFGLAQFRTIPMDVVSNSDQENIVFVIGDDLIPYTLPSSGPITGDHLHPIASQFFYLNSDVEKTVKIDISLDIRVVGSAGSSFDAYVLQRNEDDITVEYRSFFDSGNYTTNKDYLINYSGEFDLSIGDSLMIVLRASGQPATSDTVKIVYNTKPQLIVTEDSIRTDTQTYAILMHEIGDKLMQIITGEQNRFHSDFFGRTDLGYAVDGEFSRVGISLGFWIRQFYEKNMEISLDEYLNICNSVFNTGYHIEEIGGVEKLVVQDMKFYFQNATAITLPNQVSEYEEEAYKELCHSSLEFGYKKGGEYEEAMGLDEYNVKTGFTTPLTRPDTKYSKVSDGRGDSYAKEFARRKPKEAYPTTDTPYDKDLHLLDLKEGLGLALEERIWSDDLEELPTGVYSPETATNLRLIPSEIEKRHEWFFGCALTKEREKYIRYSNTGGNNNLVTKKVGEPGRKEKDNVLINTMESPRFLSKKIKFKHEVDFFVNEQLNGKTNVNGRMIPNVYFKVDFINPYNQKESGYLMQLKPNKEGDWELLKAI